MGNYANVSYHPSSPSTNTDEWARKRPVRFPGNRAESSHSALDPSETSSLRFRRPGSGHRARVQASTFLGSPFDLGDGLFVEKL